MRLFFIRHGESVDNVAGLYAGCRDSPLTIHGALQAHRLASRIAKEVVVSHVFSSPLQRSTKTAEAICDTQNQIHGAGLAVIPVPELREKDFGSLEGLSFRSVTPKDRLSAQDTETAKAMRARANSFLDDYLVPLLCCDADTNMACTVVAHAVILGFLAKAFLDRIPRGHIVLPSAPEQHGLLMDPSGPIFPPWSNAAVLEMAVITCPDKAEVRGPILPLEVHIKRVNCTTHLKSLHKTRGGIGSAPFDEKQRTMHSFFTPAPKTKEPGDATN